MIERLPVGHAFISGQAQAPFANQRSRKAGIRSTSATVKVPPAARSGRRRLERHTSTRHPQNPLDSRRYNLEEAWNAARLRRLLKATNHGLAHP